jgi:hypothetical protein
LNDLKKRRLIPKVYFFFEKQPGFSIMHHKKGRSQAQMECWVFDLFAPCSLTSADDGPAMGGAIPKRSVYQRKKGTAPHDLRSFGTLPS